MIIKSTNLVTKENMWQVLFEMYKPRLTGKNVPAVKDEHESSCRLLHWLLHASRQFGNEMSGVLHLKIMYLLH